MAQGRPVADAIRSIGVTEVTYYRWRNEYGGLKGDQVNRAGAGPPIQIWKMSQNEDPRVPVRMGPYSPFANIQDLEELASLE